jgi:hypothetical protein
VLAEKSLGDKIPETDKREKRKEKKRGVKWMMVPC